LEEYVTAVRLADDALLLVTRHTSWDRHAPADARYLDEPPQPNIGIRLYGASHATFATIQRSNEQVGLLAIDTFETYQTSGRWKCYLDFDAGTKTIRDERRGETVVTDLALSATERDLAILPVPAFGEYAILVERVGSLLRVMGYGEVG